MCLQTDQDKTNPSKNVISETCHCQPPPLCPALNTAELPDTAFFLFFLLIDLSVTPRAHAGGS